MVNVVMLGNSLPEVDGMAVEEELTIHEVLQGEEMEEEDLLKKETCLTKFNLQLIQILMTQLRGMEKDNLIHLWLMMILIFQTISGQWDHVVQEAEEEEEVEVVVDEVEWEEEGAEVDNESKQCIKHKFDRLQVKFIISLLFNCEL